MGVVLLSRAAAAFDEPGDEFGGGEAVTHPPSRGADGSFVVAVSAYPEMVRRKRRSPSPNGFAAMEGR